MSLIKQGRLSDEINLNFQSKIMHFKPTEKEDKFVDVFSGDYLIRKYKVHDGNLFKIILGLANDLPNESIKTIFKLSDKKEFLGIDLTDKIFLKNKIFAKGYELTNEWSGITFISDEDIVTMFATPINLLSLILSLKY
ncbi:hypothetical protein [Bartonella sp. DGB1]|uniref:hypothetical protein n=1 Tax=Bartonella sp. DGB1 TaxID=3239807 RepID=UPI00352442B7